MTKRGREDDYTITEKRHMIENDVNDHLYDHDFQKKHLISTNKEMANFVRRSVEIIRKQNDEIIRLRRELSLRTN